MILLDTSFLFAQYHEDDVHHKEALRLAEQHEQDQAFIISGVFQEMVTLLQRKVSLGASVEAGERILKTDSPIQLLKLDEILFELAWFKFKKLAPHKLSFVDCLLLATAEHMEVSLLTFDRELLSQLK